MQGRRVAALWSIILAATLGLLLLGGDAARPGVGTEDPTPDGRPAGEATRELGPSTSFLPVAVAVVVWRLLDR